MKTYIITTGTVFGLVTLAHVWRMIVERPLATQPWYILITAVSAALAVWAWRLVARSRGES